MKGLTFSGMERAAICPASVSLPQANRTTTWSASGTAQHAYLENVASLGMDRALALVPPEHRDTCKRIDLSELPSSKPGRYAYEVAFAYNVDTGEARVLGVGLGRQYHRAEKPPTAREICGTLDVVGVTDAAVVVADLKSGWGEVAAPRENWQLRIGALAAARAFEKDRAHVAIIFLKDGDPRWARADLTELDLDAAEGSVRRIVRGVEAARAVVESGKTPDTFPGSHCKYCSALPSCPGQMGLIAAALDKKLGPDLLNEETAPRLLARLEAIEIATKRMWESLDEYVSVRPLELGGGWVYGKTQTTRTTLKADKAQEVLAEEFNLRVEPEVKKTITQEAVKDAIRSQLPAVKITKFFDAAMERLKEAGAADVATLTTVKRHRPKPAALPASNPSPEPKESHVAPEADQQH